MNSNGRRMNALGLAEVVDDDDALRVSLKLTDAELLPLARVVREERITVDKLVEQIVREWCIG